MKFFLILSFLLNSTLIFSSSNVGIIVKKKGKVELLSSPSKNFIEGKGVVLYEGLYYLQKKARPGLKIKNGDILRTGSGSKARIVYKNGDQFNVGEGTAFKISWEKTTVNKKPASTINLINGAIRGIVSKKGPRSKLTVRSRSAVMGVRGTDFHFAQRGTSGKTSISVLRGKVEVAKKEKPKEKVNIAQGFSAELNQKVIPTKQEKKQSASKVLASLEIVKTTKNDLVEIQKDSKIINEDKEEVSKEVKQELVQLEKSAVKTTLEDIKEYQPEVYEKLKDKEITQVDTVNTVVVTKALEKAPVKKAKKGFEDMGIDLDEDSYKKYFKVEDKL